VSQARGARIGQRPFWMAAAGLGILGAALRIWSILALSGSLRVSRPILDAQYYLELARRLSEGGGWPPGAHFFGPLYPWLLSLLFRVFPATPLTVEVAQSLLGLATLLGLMLAARRWFGTAAAVAAGLLFVLCGPILAMEHQVLMESLLLFLGAVALWLWPRRDELLARHAGFGVCCGLLAAGRGTFLLLALAWLGGRLWACRRAHKSPRWTCVAVVALGMFLALLPQTVQQTRATGGLRVLTLNGGVNLYVGNNPSAQGIFSIPPGLDLHEDITGTRSASLLAGRELTTVEAGRFWTGRAVEFLRREPARAALLLAKKALLFFSPDEIPQIDDFQELAGETLPLRVAALRFGWILPLALAGILAHWRQHGAGPGPGANAAQVTPASRGESLIPWVALIAVAWIQTVVFFAAGRYRLPVMGALLGLAGVGLAALISAVRVRRYWAPVLVVAACGLLAIAPPGYPREKARCFDAYQLGKRCTQAGNFLQALGHYDRAIALWPAAGEVWHDRGVALLRLGRAREAADSFERALAQMPGSAVTWYALGAARSQAGQPDRAIEALERAVALSPANPRYRLDLGTALATLGRTEEAEAQWRAVLGVDPENEEAQAHLSGGAARP
jgi:hypothetical protein